MNSVHVTTESKQDYATRIEFVRLVELAFGVAFNLDAAASEENAKAQVYYTEADDALSRDWVSDHPLLLTGRQAVWLNPPFKRLDPWMAKCAEEAKKGARIISLTLAGTSQWWYLNHVRRYGMALHLRERLTFEGQTELYPKDLMITLWGFGMVGQGWWSWK